MATRATPLRAIIVGFDHMHVSGQIDLAQAHEHVELVAAYDDPQYPGRAERILGDKGVSIPICNDLERMLNQHHPDIAFVCTTTNAHAEITAAVAKAGAHLIIEKPMATSVTEADAMVNAASAAGVELVVNWPLAWYPVHRTAQRLIVEGAIGTVIQIHYYDGNRGPLLLPTDTRATGPSNATKNASWWYDPKLGGGSLRDYLGYGATLSTWFRDGEVPTTIFAATHTEDGMRVDEQSVTIARYPSGLSVFETQWGTLSDPWTRQPSPRCGFAIGGNLGTIESWDFAEAVVVHQEDRVHSVPVDTPAPEDRSALANLVAHILHGRPITPPISSTLSRLGQLIVDRAIDSARDGRSLSIGLNGD